MPSKFSLYLFLILMYCNTFPPKGIAQNTFTDQEATHDIWATLFKVKYGNWKIRFAPQFPKEIRSLDGKLITIQGFLIPLEQKKRHSSFLLSAFPFDQCFYCGKAGPETVIEVTKSKPIKSTEKPITIIGKLQLNYTNPNHLFYIMKDVKLSN